MIDRRLVHKYWWVGGYCLAHQYLHIILPKEGEGRERKNPPKNHESNLYMLWVAMLLKCQSKRIYIFVEFQQLRICHPFWAILPKKKQKKKPITRPPWGLSTHTTSNLLQIHAQVLHLLHTYFIHELFIIFKQKSHSNSAHYRHHEESIGIIRNSTHCLIQEPLHALNSVPSNSKFKFFPPKNSHIKSRMIKNKIKAAIVLEGNKETKWIRIGSWQTLEHQYLTQNFPT